MRFLLGILLTFSVTLLQAEDHIDFENVFSNTRVGIFVDQHFNKLNGVYTALASYNKNKLELVNLNIGYVQRVEENRNSPLVQFALRLDSLLKVLDQTSFSQKSITSSPLPQIEFGPFISTLFSKEEGHLKTSTRYGIGLALRL